MKKLLTSTSLFFFFHLLVVAQESGVPDVSIKFEKDTYQFSAAAGVPLLQVFAAHAALGVFSTYGMHTKLVDL